MSLIKSKMITDAMPSDETYKKLLEHVGLPEGTSVGLMVL